MSRKIIFVLLRQVKALFWLRHESFSTITEPESVSVQVSDTAVTICCPNDERRFHTDI